MHLDDSFLASMIHKYEVGARLFVSCCMVIKFNIIVLKPRENN